MEMISLLHYNTRAPMVVVVASYQRYAWLSWVSCYAMWLHEFPCKIGGRKPGGEKNKKLAI